MAYMTLILTLSHSYRMRSIAFVDHLIGKLMKIASFKIPYVLMNVTETMMKTSSVETLYTLSTTTTKKDVRKMTYVCSLPNIIIDSPVLCYTMNNKKEIINQSI